jgi:5-methylcytosine-specific restriction endonuclease McrA
MKKEIAIDKLIEYSDKCVNMYDLCEKIGIKNSGGNNYKEVRKLTNELGIELKFSYKKNYYTNRTLSVKKIDMSEILVENSTYKNGNSLKRRLISEGYKENRCECCGIDSWNGKEISLQLHHINGNHSDNRIENLQILCPNCHSQTETYAGKNSNKENITTNLVKNRKMDATEWSNINKELCNR